MSLPLDLTKPMECSTEASLRGLAIRRMSNAQLGRGVAEGGPRYGDQWARTSAHDSDLGYGFFLAEFDGEVEYLAVIKHNGETKARLYSVSTSGTFTAITANGSDDLTASAWEFTQYDAYIYAMNATDGIWRRRVGGAVGSPGDAGYTIDDEWRRFEPEFVRATDLDLETSRPPYAVHTWPGTTTITGFSQSGSAFGLDGSPASLDSQKRIYLRQADSVSGRVNAWTFVVCSLSEALDLSRVDRLFFRLADGAGEPEHLDPSSAYSGIWLTENAALTINDFGDLTGLPKITIQSKEVDSNEFHVWGDLAAIPRADRNAVRQIVFGFMFGFETAGYVYLRDLTFGGTLMVDDPDGPEAVDYAYAYRNPTTGAMTGAIVETLPFGEADGQAPSIWAFKLGAWVTLSPLVDSGLNGDGFTKIRLYRKETKPVSGRDRVWRYLGEVDNSGTPTWVDSLTEAELVAQDEATLSFDGFAATLPAEAIGLWKQSLILGLDRKAFMSFAGRPNRFLPPPEQINGQVRDDDLDAGRTLYVGHGQIDELRAFVAQDSLYLLTDRGVYVMVGDQVADATPPRLLPGSRACLGPRAVCKFQTGILVAALDGLWFYEATRAFSGSNDGTMRAEELTFTVRDAWKDLMAQSGSVVVCEHEDDVWVFKGTRFLKMTRPQPVGGRHWEEGTWPSVAVAVPDQARGLRLMLTNGKVIRAGTNSSGAAYTQDLTTPVTWSVRTGDVVGGRIAPSHLKIEGTGEVTATFRWTDGQRQPTEQSKSITGNGIWRVPTHLDPMSRWSLELSGVVGSAAAHRVTVEGEDEEDNRT